MDFNKQSSKYQTLLEKLKACTLEQIPDFFEEIKIKGENLDFNDVLKHVRTFWKDFEEYQPDKSDSYVYPKYLDHQGQNITNLVREAYDAIDRFYDIRNYDEIHPHLIGSICKGRSPHNPVYYISPDGHYYQEYGMEYVNLGLHQNSYEEKHNELLPIVKAMKQECDLITDTVEYELEYISPDELLEEIFKKFRKNEHTYNEVYDLFERFEIYAKANKRIAEDVKYMLEKLN